jgi:hypothetical protein
MAVEVSSYKEFLADRHGTNHAIKIFPKLPLGALAKTYLRGIGTDFWLAIFFYYTGWYSDVWHRPLHLQTSLTGWYSNGGCHKIKYIQRLSSKNPFT